MHTFLLIDEIEIDSINYAMDTIEKLSARIYEKTGNRLVETMSEILRGITGGACRELLIDEDFHIRVDTGSDLVSIENLRLITVGQYIFLFALPWVRSCAVLRSFLYCWKKCLAHMILKMLLRLLHGLPEIRDR